MHELTGRTHWHEPTGDNRAGFGEFGRPKTPYDLFMESEGIPIYRDIGVSKVQNLPLAPWRRMGGKGSYIQLRGTDPGPIHLGYRVFATRDDDLNDYQTIIYQKGAWVVHMLRILTLDLKTMNEDRFTGIMKDFYRKYEGRRASTEDFRRVVERHTNTDMGWFFDQFVYGAEIPTYRVAHKVEKTADGQYRVKLRVRQEGVPESFQMYVPVTLALGKKQAARFRVRVAGPFTELELPPVPVEPKKVVFNDLEGVLAEVKTAGWD